MTNILNRIYHILKHTDVEVHIVEKHHSFKAIKQRDGSYEKREQIPAFQIEGADVATQVFQTPRSLGKSGNSKTVIVPAQLAEFLDGQQFESIHIVATPKRTLSVALLGVLKDGVEVKEKDGR